MTIRRMMAWGASVPSSPALSRTALRLRGLTARPAQAGGAFMCNARSVRRSGHLQLFLDAYNHARRLKTLRGLTPYEHVLQVWTKEPERFRLDPSHHIPGPYN